MGNASETLERRLNELYAIGAEPGGGAFRPLYSEPWAEALARVEGWMKAAGLTTRRDAVGNLWGRIDGDGNAIVTGSHIDTVRRGGRLDGALGICAGLTAVESLLKERGKPRRALEVVAICEEEGSRFATNFWGSRAITGAITDIDPDIAAAMRERGFDPTTIHTAARDDIDTFVELHIEQGAVLETSGHPLAVVSAIVGTAHLESTVTGRSDHAGTTPMDLRRDALAGAAVMIQATESIARSLGKPAVATVGKIQVEPDHINVIPGRVLFTIDLRHPELAARRALEERIRSVCATVASERGLGLDVRVLQEKAPVPMHPDVRALLARAARDAGVAATELVSGAGHDAQILAARCKVGMLFVPSVGGRSHCPEETTKPADLAGGLQVLTRALELLAY
ncbi:MAG TPA: Zn-dependent hydrolase [Gemmatimonadales bacterium]|jgi:allantoate deiminase